MTNKNISCFQRTCLCGQISEEHLETQVTLMGWVDRFRDHKGVFFIDLRDISGVVQVVLDISKHSSIAKDIKEDSVLSVDGKVQKRLKENPKLLTGQFEVQVESKNGVKILSHADPLPLQAEANEETRLKYRYLDLRKPHLQQNLIKRHHFYQIVRKYLCQNRFLEIETPILYKSTPEGARDYLVPSRIEKGHFYALVQSPQILKQLLMVSGMDRYFQIAKCFRDEDLRADRQPEFTQIDIEMAFVDKKDVMSLTEGLIKVLWKELLNIDIPHIAQWTYEEAMNKYGTDKPDLRFELEICDLTETYKSLPELAEHIKENSVVKGIKLSQDMSVSQMKKFVSSDLTMQNLALVWIKSDKEGHLKSSHRMSEKAQKQIFANAKAQHGDTLFVMTGEWAFVCTALGKVRLKLAEMFHLIKDKNDFQFAWVIDFPLFSQNEEGHWGSTHHPFTSPTDKASLKLHDMLGTANMNYQDKELTARSYDLVCNGHEIGGGSIRIHDQEIQKNIFTALGLTPEDIQNKFGFFIEALQYGTPPHGGIALGVDRMVMLLCKTDAIRDVIAFPKTTKASCLMSNAPSVIKKEQLSDLGLKTSTEMA